jgi:hypothetical protein
MTHGGTTVDRDWSPVLWPFLFGATLYLAILAVQAWLGWRGNNGFFCYALDDAYLHMAIARNLALHGVWGLNAGGFASASSSPGWTLLLSGAVRILGDRVWLSLALNAFFALLLLWFADRTVWLWAPGRPVWVRVALQISLVLFVPLPNLALVGMEHSAQAFGAVWLIAMAAGALTIPPQLRVPSRTIIGLLAASFFLCAIRYETVLIVIPVLIALFWRGRWKIAVAFAVVSALPPLLFGIYARVHGPFWLPYSVLAKAHAVGHLHTLIFAGFDQWTRKGILSAAALLFGGVALWLARSSRRARWEKAQIALALGIIVLVEHLTLAPMGWLMRYEAYLFAVILFAAAAGVSQEWPIWRAQSSVAGARRQWAAVAVLVAALFYPALADRAYKGIVDPVEAMHDRYFEHLQPTFFIQHNYAHAVVVASDIGAISYYTDAKVLDPIGLGSPEPLLLERKTGTFAPRDLDAWALRDGAQIAVLETGWLTVRKIIPVQWVCVEAWHIPRNVVYHNLDISFYAIDPEQAPELKRKLSAVVLPKGMTRTD